MYATVNGVKIFFDIEGLEYVPDGPRMRQRPVCFVLHGGPGGEHSHFLPAFSKMAEYMQLIYVDDRNCGRSERCDLQSSTIKQNADDIEALRKYLGLGKVFIYGHSYGGMKAQRYMIDYPENLYGVILSDCRANSAHIDASMKVVESRGTPKQIELFKRFRAGNESVSLDEMMATMCSIYNYNCTTPEQLEEIMNCEKRCINNNELVAFQYPGELAEVDHLPELVKTHVPTLILVGKYDHITPVPYSEDLHKAMPHSELHIIDKCCHECFCDRPDYVFPCVADFVERNFKPE